MKFVGVLGVLVGTLVGASGALASARITYPADGQTVPLDKQGRFTFRWTLPVGERGPAVYVGDTPTYDPDTLYPFTEACGAQDPDQVIYSCADTEKPIPAGSHYAFIFTQSGDPSSRDVQNHTSPVTRFVVPSKLSWGCSPASSCGGPVVSRAYNSNPTVGPPESDLDANVWLNSIKAPVRFTFTLRNGRRVVKVIRRTARSDGDYQLDAGFVAFQVGDRGPYRTAVKLQGIHGVRWLQVTIVARARGLAIRRVVKFRAPPSCYGC